MIIEFGAERPFETMAAAQGAALAARRINAGRPQAEIGMFEADQGIEFAKEARCRRHLNPWSVCPTRPKCSPGGWPNTANFAAAWRSVTGCLS